MTLKAYFGVFGALIALTIGTVAISKIDLGEFNFIAAMTIAVTKGTLVLLFFMHLKKASSTTMVFAAAGLFWLAILLVFVSSDYISRGWLPGGRWW